MIFSIDPSNGTPVYEQISRQLAFAVASGALKSGELIPSVRQMARDLAVNPNTVARAYRELQAEGIVSPLRGTGLQVSQGAVRKCATIRKEFIRTQIKNIIDDARQSQLSDEEILAAFQSELKKPRRNPRNSSAQSRTGEKS